MLLARKILLQIGCFSLETHGSTISRAPMAANIATELERSLERAAPGNKDKASLLSINVGLGSLSGNSEASAS